MGERGPAPRREAEVRRTNNKGKAEQVYTDDLEELPFEVDTNPAPPASPEGWHSVVQVFWDSLQRDPARKWMTAADWAATMMFCEAMSRELQDQVVGVHKETGEVTWASQPPKGATLAAFLKLLDHIGVTETARMRMQKEINLFPRPDAAGGATVVDIHVVRDEEVQ